MILAWSEVLASLSEVPLATSFIMSSTQQFLGGTRDGRNQKAGGVPHSFSVFSFDIVLKTPASRGKSGLSQIKVYTTMQII